MAEVATHLDGDKTDAHKADLAQKNFDKTLAEQDRILEKAKKDNADADLYDAYGRYDE